MTTESWDRRFLAMAELIATWSKDRSTKVGAVIVGSRKRVLSVGYNGMPRGVDDENEGRHARPEKYFWFEHGERNAIYNAGCSLEGATLYVTDDRPIHFPICMDCARAIVQAGIARVVSYAWDLSDPKWGEHGERVRALFGEAGVELVAILP